MKFKLFALLLTIYCVIWQNTAQANISVMTTLSDLNSLVAEIGGKEVSSDSFCKGTQDPHTLEPKPSYMVKASHADLIIAMGMGLEVGWLSSIIQGARNPKIQTGQRGYLEVGTLIEPLEVPQGKVTRAQGDVHPEGNPHFNLDPIRMGNVAIAIGDRLAELDQAHGELFKSRAQALKTRLANKTKEWETRIAKSGVKKIITFHKTLTYFFDRFHIENPAILEPLPGIPPTAKHTIEVINTAKNQKIPLILVENFFDSVVAERVAKDVPGIRVRVVPVYVGGDASVKNLDDLYEGLVKSIEEKIGNG